MGGKWGFSPKKEIKLFFSFICIYWAVNATWDEGRSLLKKFCHLAPNLISTTVCFKVLRGAAIVNMALYVPLSEAMMVYKGGDYRFLTSKPSLEFATWKKKIMEKMSCT